jgi:N-acetylglucosamine-6-phosphate deacetylase
VKVVGTNRLALISDAIAAAGLGDGQYEIWGETIRVAGGRTENAAGHLAGSVITLLDAVRHLVQWGMPLSEAIHMASLGPARVLGVHETLGSLAPGKAADILVLDQNLSPRLVVHKGALVHLEPPPRSADGTESETSGLPSESATSPR